MKKPLAVAWLFLMISFGATAQGLVHTRIDRVHVAGLKTHSSIADTPESPDEHVRERQHEVGKAV
ncbi:hypothetical protein ACQV2E_07095 [Pantoea allii]|uniref:Secreted protein n=1 Tax=Pantoea allii TaxID=574096 RepID=A0A2V2BN22_9GAMM|nr:MULTISPECIES: hypothetical protein [Pantoea]MBW1212577.1 hypothetical protein [Pantoea allii]MBW1254369.1 hypothetical protein [Pantoea allii]MBW1255785.1 hypothetical protein [Pantoea allii]MBW1263654.1 hypothetical protein [Pantoea allii]MBW1264862.1 hypothetical protein [Pantoea allii]